MSENILFLGDKIFEIPPFFQTRPGDLGKKVHACSLRFSALKRSSHLKRPAVSHKKKCVLANVNKLTTRREDKENMFRFRFYIDVYFSSVISLL